MMKHALKALADQEDPSVQYVSSARGHSSRLEQLHATREYAFLEMLDRELAKASAFATSKVAELSTRLTSVQRRMLELRVEPETLEDARAALARLDESTREIADEICDLDTFFRQNCLGAEKIVKKVCAAASGERSERATPRTWGHTHDL